MMPWGGRIRLLLAIAATAVVVLALGRYLSRPKDQQVSIAQVKVGPFDSWIATNGVVEPADPRVIRAPVATFVQKVQAVEGQPVRRGDVLMTLDLALQRAELARARGDLVAAENDLRLDEAGGPAAERAQVESDLHKAEAEAAHLGRDRDGIARLVAQQAATRDELAQAELALIRAEANREALAARLQALRRQAAKNVELRRLSVAQARETVKMLQAQLSSADVRSPIDGIVYSLPARPGNRMDVGAILAAVADLRAVQVRAFVDEPELASVREDQLVKVSWPAVPNHDWTGRTARVPKNVVPRGDRRVGEVICSVDNENRQLIPNLGVDVRIRIQSRDRALLVPRAAVRGDQTGRYVFVVQDRALHRRPVVTDVASTTSYSITEGLSAGEWVAVPGNVDLRDGMRVQVAPDLP